MKLTRRILVVICASSLALSSLLQAQEHHGNWYLRADAGGAHVMSADVDEFLLPTPGGRISFHSGVRLGIAGGYQFLPWLAAEVETGLFIHGVDKLNGQPIDAGLIQAPFMANLVVQCNHFGQFVPMVGGGAGGVASLFSVDQWFSIGNDLLWLEGSETDLVAAYQAFAGLRYDFNPRMGLGLIYRFLGTGAPRWDVENRLGGEAMRIQFDKLHTHAVAIQFQFRF
jgi:opacity protein-like surface antigen